MAARLENTKSFKMSSGKTRARKRKNGLCEVLYCNRNSAHNRAICYRHARRRYKETNFIGYTYDTLKQNARVRGKEFTLTREEFRKFCDETGYLEGKGKKSTSMSIDRKDPTKGYSIDNIQILSLSDNTKKQHEDSKEESNDNFNDDLPF